MKILLWIHPAMPFLDRRAKYGIRDHFSKDPNSFLLLFVWRPHIDPGILEELKKEYPDLKDRLIAVRAASEQEAKKSFYGNPEFYRTSLSRAIQSIKKRLAPNEMVEVVSFGGAEMDSYRKLSGPAFELIKDLLGEKRIRAHRQDRRLIWGRQEDLRKLRPKRYSRLPRTRKPRRK